MEERGFIGKMLLMMGGLLVWGAHFTVIYGFNALACARRFAHLEILGLGIVPLVIGAATIVALTSAGALLAVAVYRRGPFRISANGGSSEPFMRYTTIALAALSVVAIAWNALPAYIVWPCA